MRIMSTSTGPKSYIRIPRGRELGGAFCLGFADWVLCKIVLQCKSKTQSEPSAPGTRLPKGSRSWQKPMEFP